MSRRLRLVAAMVLVAATVLATPATAAAAPEIVTVSNRADLVSGGDVLVEVRLPEGSDPASLRVTRNGSDVTGSFATGPDGRLVGLVSGLRDGENELTADVAASPRARLTVTNHPLSGPVFSGQQVRPWLCETHLYGMPPATGPECAAETRHDFFYRSRVTGEFEPFDPGSPPDPALVAETTTDRGVTVPYFVRRERGVINRGIYDIAVLFDPGQPWQAQQAFNGKLHWLFGWNCKPGHRQAGGASNNIGEANGYRPDSDHGPVDVLASPLLADLPLSKGYVVASSSLTRAGASCNDIVSAETVMMIKERIIERYGPVRFTVGDGCSGGAVQQYLIAANYPGLLDGLLTYCSFPDVWTTVTGSADCTLLHRYFNQVSPHLWTDPLDRAAVTGGLGGASCQVVGADATSAAAAIMDPRTGCTSSVVNREEADWAYDPVSNPDGVRCTLQDYQAAAFGFRASDGFANRPLDSVGVEYGLTALASAVITAEQFADLNGKIGGWDIDYDWTSSRIEADIAGLDHVYRSGRLVDGSRLDRVPILDLRGSQNVDGHDDVYTQAMKARLIASNGHAENHVAWTSVSTSTAPDATMSRRAFETLDAWLTAIEADAGADSLAAKVRRHRPPQATDSCWIAGRPDTCGSNLPYYGSPRSVAGGPLAHDVFKCRLKPLDWDRYPVEFTGDQRQQLTGAFPTGVCDWSRPGVGQQPPAGVWQSYATTTGGQPMPAPPRSAPRSGHPK